MVKNFKFLPAAFTKMYGNRLDVGKQDDIISWYFHTKCFKKLKRDYQNEMQTSILAFHKFVTPMRRCKICKKFNMKETKGKEEDEAPDGFVQKRQEKRKIQ